MSIEPEVQQVPLNSSSKGLRSYSTPLANWIENSVGRPYGILICKLSRRFEDLIQDRVQITYASLHTWILYGAAGS